MTDIQQQIKEKKEAIEKAQKELLELESEAEGNNSEYLEVPELGIKIEIKVHDKGKSWNQLKLSEKEHKLLTAQHCLFLMSKEGEKYAKILKMDGSSSDDDFFIKQYSEFSKKNGYVTRFYARSDYSYLSSDEDSDDSYPYLGVRFCLPLPVKKEKK